jgi:hypothetical protein
MSANDKILELERAFSDYSLESDPDEPTGAAAIPVYSGDSYLTFNINNYLFNKLNFFSIEEIFVAAKLRI